MDSGSQVRDITPPAPPANGGFWYHLHSGRLADLDDYITHSLNLLNRRPSVQSTFEVPLKLGINLEVSRVSI